jgi:hypothetical protein
MTPHLESIEIEPLPAVPVDVNFPEAKRSMFSDPHDKQMVWQIRCISRELVRTRICGYFGFRRVTELRRWEESSPKRWTHIWSYMTKNLPKVNLVDVLRIIWNDGDPVATILEYIEHQQPWIWLEAQAYEYIVRKRTFKTPTTVASAHAVIMIAATTVWIILQSPAQFDESGHFLTQWF